MAATHLLDHLEAMLPGVIPDAPEAWFRSAYDCPCGTYWEAEDDCACDDRCPDCSTSCSPSHSWEV